MNRSLQDMVPFAYRRESFHSSALGAPTCYGLVRFGDGPVRGTLYLLHGGNGDDRQLVEAKLLEALPRPLTDRLRELGIQIVLPFIGTSFLSDRSPHAAAFVDEVIPAVEKGTSTTSRTRWIGGLSMGGQAALSFFLRNSGLFAGVGAHFPTILPFDFRDDSAAADYERRARVAPGYLGLLLGGLRAEFPDYEHYLTHDPLRIASGLDARDLAGKRIVLDVGSDDEFGLHEGVAAFHEVLAARGVPHEYQLVQGGKHDAAFLGRQMPAMIGALLG